MRPGYLITLIILVLVLGIAAMMIDNPKDPSG